MRDSKVSSLSSTAVIYDVCGFELLKVSKEHRKAVSPLQRLSFKNQYIATLCRCLKSYRVMRMGRLKAPPTL